MLVIIGSRVLLLHILVLTVLSSQAPDTWNYLNDNWVGSWHNLPEFLINLVFASLFLGADVPSASVVWEKSGNQLLYGLVVSWGQMLTGFLVTGIILVPVFNANPMIAQTLPIGFAGGHGTAAAMTQVMANYDFPDGGSISLGTATFGLVMSVLVGIALVNFAASRGWVKYSSMQSATSRLAMQGIVDQDNRPIAGFKTVSGDSIDVLAWHLVVVGIACLIGLGMKGLLTLASPSAFGSFPEFPLCMIGGMILQTIMGRLNKFGGEEVKLVDANMMERIAGTSLDFLIVGAISTVSVSAIEDNIFPFLILCAFGLAWEVFCIFFISPIINPTHWFENAIPVFGQDTGVIAAGLMLLRMVDPESKTPVPAAFGYKQVVHSTFMGGGFITAFWVPLQGALGLWITTAITAGCMGGCILVWMIFLRPQHAAIKQKYKEPEEQEEREKMLGGGQEMEKAHSSRSASTSSARSRSSTNNERDSSYLLMGDEEKTARKSSSSNPTR
jgi:ESS family glutamate:Na+ symporter